MRTALVIAAALLSSGAAPATQTAIFAGGCFWSTEKGLEGFPGVIDVVSGYSGGAKQRPTYEDHTGHYEAVRVTFDPAKVSYAKLVDRYFRNIDPTDAGGQICDRGHSYQTAIFVAGEAQRQTAAAAKAAVQKQLGKPVATAVLNASTFWPAEAYHQNYAKKNPAHYNAYRIGCGRDRALKAVWGASAVQ
jgi:peptide-methionine (S)-S-oxide reductase